MWKTVLLIFILLMLGGCAQKMSRAPSDIKSASSYKQLHNYGELVYVKNFVGGSRNGLKIDGEFIGSFGDDAYLANQPLFEAENGAYYIAQLKPGVHEITFFIDFTNQKEKLIHESFNIKAGERKFYVESGKSIYGWKADVSLANKKFMGYVIRDTGIDFDPTVQKNKASDTKTDFPPSKGTESEAPMTSLDKLIVKENKPPNYNRYALIIGISAYQEQTNVTYADNSAKSFKLAATHILGIPEDNIILLLNDRATSGTVKSKLAIISELAEPEDELFIYFAGHGVPGKDGYTYLLPYDMSADAIHMEKRLQLEQIYKTLAASQARKIMVFMDTCFSGKDDQGHLVYKGVAPVLKKRKTLISSDKLTIMSAGSYNDFANQKASEEQRLFTYYLLKGMSDGKTDINDLYRYVRKKVKRDSLKLGIGYKQVPQLIVGEQ